MHHTASSMMTFGEFRVKSFQVIGHHAESMVAGLPVNAVHWKILRSPVRLGDRSKDLVVHARDINDGLVFALKE